MASLSGRELERKRLSLIMLGSKRIWKKIEELPIDLKTQPYGLICHPLQGNVRKSRIIFWIASANIRVIARKPHLHKLLNAICVRSVHITPCPPFHPWKGGS